MKTEEFRVNGQEAWAEIKKLFGAIMLRSFTLKNTKNENIIELPLIVFIIIAIIAPTLALIAILIALLVKCTIVIEKKA